MSLPGIWKKKVKHQGTKEATKGTKPLVLFVVIFVPFVLIYMKQPLKLDYLWAALCMLGAVYFIFRK